jgi:two-component system chemotaxis response regulator CheY
MSLKIMVVDDEPRTSARVRSVAAPLGYSVQPFDDYQAATQKGETQHFDAIFVGMRSPKLDGVEFVRRIRESDPNHDSVVVMLSATEDISSLRKAIGAGADLVLVKPVAGERLHRMLLAFPEWKDKRHAARLPLFTEVGCTCNGRQSALRSLNISETGMLLQPAPDLEVGRQVALEFKIAEIHASLNVVASIVRKEETELIGVAFIALAPEDVNAIHVYVTGRMKELTRKDYLSDTRPRRLFKP